LITTGESTIVKVIEEGRPDPKPEPKPIPPTPEPKPDPKPTPGPQPSPKMSVAWAVWVYEQADAINQVPQTNTRLSAETRRFLDSRGIKMAAYDDDQEAAKAKPFLDAAGSKPSLLLMQDANKYVVRKAPSSVDELKAMVKEVTGE
jgi:outer membrane biosynthesis protein TonB